MKNLLILVLSSFFLFVFASAGFSQDDPEQMRVYIKKAYDVFSKGEYDKMEQFIDKSFVEHSPMPGQKQGLDGLIDVFKTMRTAYPDMKFAVNDIIVEKDKAAVLFTFTGTNTGEFMGMAPTGKSVNVQGIDYLLFKDGKCIEHWGYIDESKMMQQLGMTK